MEVAYRLYTQPRAQCTCLPRCTKATWVAEVVQSQVALEARRPEGRVQGLDSPIPAP